MVSRCRKINQSIHSYVTHFHQTIESLLSYCPKIVICYHNTPLNSSYRPAVYNHYYKVDSYQQLCHGQARAGLAEHGTVYFAYEQTPVRARGAKAGSAEPDENIMISVLFKPKACYQYHQFQFIGMLWLSLVMISLKNYASGEFTRIKWPNDLYWQDRKAGGILD